MLIIKIIFFICKISICILRKNMSSFLILESVIFNKCMQPFVALLHDFNETYYRTVILLVN